MTAVARRGEVGEGGSRFLRRPNFLRRQVIDHISIYVKYVCVYVYILASMHPPIYIRTPCRGQLNIFCTYWLAVSLIKKEADVIVESASSPALQKSSPSDEVPMNPEQMMEALDIQNKDTWDSVTTQPTCVICSMTFPNQSKLDRHVKYSSMHANAVKKLEAAKNEGNTTYA